MVDQHHFLKFLKGEPIGPNSHFEQCQANTNIEQNGIASNGKMIALQWHQMATIAVLKASDPKRLEPGLPLIKGHQGPISDIAWSPFEDRLLASTADDGTCKLWVFEDYEGLKASTSEADLVLEAAPRKCLGVQWHNSVDSLLATNAQDKTVKVWDINEGRADDPAITINNEEIILNMQWSRDGKHLAGMGKNRHIFVLDPRVPDSVMNIAGHSGPRQHRVQWVDENTLITSGFDHEAKRQWGLFDLRQPDQSLAMGPLSDGTGVGYIFYDQELNCLTVAGRGDSGISHYSIKRDKTVQLEAMSSNTYSGTTKAFNFAPKHVVDISRQEAIRAYRMTNEKKLEILAFRVPSKTGGFNEALYPPFLSNEAASDTDTWLAGTDVAPKTTKLEPQKGAAKKSKGLGGLARLKTGTAKTSLAEETKGPAQAAGADVEALQAEIASLKAKLQAAQASAGAGAAVEEDFTSKPELGYWKIRGLAAQIRYMFYYLNVDFTDTLYEQGDAPDFDKSCWLDVKFSLGLEYPNLPYLIDGDVKLTETVAIMQYIAKKWDASLLGRNAAEHGRVNMLLDKVADLKMKATMPCYTTGDKEGAIETCRPILKGIVDVMGDSPWIAGQNLTWLDFFFAELVSLLDALSDGLFNAEFPGLAEYWERFVSLPNLKEAWEDDTKCMKTPYNNKIAQLLN